eukprot:2582250-Rhodomonas_salina.1
MMTGDIPLSKQALEKAKTVKLAVHNFEAPVNSASCLRTCYAMPGTVLEHSTVCLCSRYKMLGTDLSRDATRLCSMRETTMQDKALLCIPCYAVYSTASNGTSYLFTRGARY